jgi:hypothetical protein
VALSRGIDPPTLAALSAPVFFPVLFVYIDWPGGAVRVHSGVGSITWGGHTWLGVGAAGEIETQGEALSPASARSRLTLYGPFDALLAQSAVQARQRAGAIYLGTVTQRGGNVLTGLPFPVFEGFVDGLRFSARDQGGDIRFGLQVDLLSGPSLRANAAIFHSAADQQAAFPGDTAGRHLISIEARVQRTTWPES